MPAFVELKSAWLATSGECMKVVSYNIQFGRGLDGVIDLVRTCRAIRGADIICLQEVDQCWKRSHEKDQAVEIAGLMPSYYYVYGSSFDVDASSRAAHGAVINRRRRHGNMILSRWPIQSSRSLNLPKQHFADKFNMQMTCVEAVIDTGSIVTRVYSYHAGYLGTDERLAQVNEFASVFARSPEEKGAWSGKADIDGDDWSNQRKTPQMPRSAIVCGDFNAGPGTREYRLLLESTGLTDCWVLADPANQQSTTLRKAISEDIQVDGKIDHILITPDLCERLETVAIDSDADGSDHKPIRAIFNSAAAVEDY
jgi:endonuclease/exonuclease/phosphatase family metal-dependent hydrolase